MPETIQREDGSTAEVFTAEEVEAAKKAEAERATQAASAAAQEQLTKAQADLKAKEEELAKFQNKDLNFGNLREAKDKLEKDIADLKSSIPAQVQAATVSTYVEEAIPRLAQGDKDLEAKIKVHYDQRKSPTDTKEEAQRKLHEAYTLARAGEPQGPDPISAILSSSGAAPSSSPQSGSSSKPPLNETQKAVAANLGITDEDIKKYDK